MAPAFVQLRAGRSSKAVVLRTVSPGRAGKCGCFGFCGEHPFAAMGSLNTGGARALRSWFGIAERGWSPAAERRDMAAGETFRCVRVTEARFALGQCAVRNRAWRFGCGLKNDAPPSPSS